MGVVGWETVKIHKDNNMDTTAVMGFATESSPLVCLFLKLLNNVGMTSNPIPFVQRDGYGMQLFRTSSAKQQQ